jgi:ligand-binding sensor domain-containing protein
MSLPTFVANWQTDQGLPVNSIMTIAQTKDGWLFFGTEDGLSDDYILTLYEDQEENLWVGTADNGLNLIRDVKVTQFAVKDGLMNEMVLAVLEDDFGDFWISCNKGIYKTKNRICWILPIQN